MTLLGALLWMALLGASAWAQGQDFSKVQISTVPVADGIYMLVGFGGNIGVSAGADGVLLVDDQFGELTDKILAAVGDLSDQPVRMVLNTHWHGDHSGGNENLAAQGALIIAHDNVRARMSQPFFSEFFQSESPASPAGALPVITFDNELTVHVNGLTVLARHYPPAHTDGDAVVWFKGANVVHMGDLYFNGLYPFIDFNSGGSIRGMIAAIDAALPDIDDSTKVIPGHGPLSDRAGLTRFRDMLNTVADRVQALMDAGKSTDEIIAAKPTAEFDETWGGGFIKPDQWVGLVCKGMGCP